MAVEAPDLPPQEGTPIHNSDSTHPRGNYQLDARMAHARGPHEKEARWQEGYAKATRDFGTGSEEAILAQVEKIRAKAEAAREKGEQAAAEAERQLFLEEHPELTQAARRVVGEQGARLRLVAEPIEDETTAHDEKDIRDFT